MEDNAAAQDFLSRLPLEVPLNDYNNITEKIFYPSPALTTTGVTRGVRLCPVILQSMCRGIMWRSSVKAGHKAMT